MIVRSAPFHGPIEVSVRGVSLALGRGVASKVFVKQLKDEN
jgi:Fe2+ transport system protein FeoA